jgi:hypothetical protein
MFVDEKLNHLIQALRVELQQYGEMLVRLDRHQQFIAHESGGDLSESAGEIQTQGAAIQRARQNCEQARRAVARTLGLYGEVPVEKIIPLLPPDYQPLVNALVSENRELLAQVLQSLERNQFLLARSLTRMEYFLNTVFPGDFNRAVSTRTPDASGFRVRGPAPPALPEFELAARKI